MVTTRRNETFLSPISVIDIDIDLFAGNDIFLAFCMAISKRVLSRMCLYWLPRYLLHLRMKDLSKDPDFADKDGFKIQLAL